MTKIPQTSLMNAPFPNNCSDAFLIKFIWNVAFGIFFKCQYYNTFFKVFPPVFFSRKLFRGKAKNVIHLSTPAPTNRTFLSHFAHFKKKKLQLTTSSYEKKIKENFSLGRNTDQCTINVASIVIESVVTGINVDHCRY